MKMVMLTTGTGYLTPRDTTAFYPFWHWEPAGFSGATRLSREHNVRRRMLCRVNPQPAPLLQDLISLGDSKGCVWALKGLLFRLQLAHRCC